jgi:poly-beta-1,6-N-acetyl-D-glucosamine synthase
MCSSSDLIYVLVTPARNEEGYIHLTLESVVRQTVLPLRWAIVSDGSTDRTDQIVGEYVRHYPWIELVRMGERSGRDFARKVTCFNAGYSRLKSLTHDVVGSLDADISFPETYFEFLLQKFSEDPSLGIAGTPFSENGQTYDYRFSSVEHVSGACQMFRRPCFESIGGYVPLKGGGIDVVAVLSARYKGWRTRTFTEITSCHNRPMGLATSRSKLAADFGLGQRAYRLGWHPLWQVCRSVYQMTRKPYIVGGCSLLAGYLAGAICRTERPVPSQLMAFQRRDQMRRLRKFVKLGQSIKSKLVSNCVRG